MRSVRSRSAVKTHVHKKILKRRRSHSDEAIHVYMSVDIFLYTYMMCI